jgi:hypothetical protein
MKTAPLRNTIIDYLTSLASVKCKEEQERKLADHDRGTLEEGQYIALVNIENVSP